MASPGETSCRLDRIRVTNMTRVCPEITSTTPQPNLIKLSFFDVLWVGTRLLLYPSAPPLRSASHSLISSLSLALSRFLPLSGRLAASDEAEIAFSGDGIAFSEAEAEGDIGRIANHDVYDWEAFRSLVPDLEAGELLAVQEDPLLNSRDFQDYAISIH
ncbi:hypothetical protein J5N97_002030 [Dioscorea zingiberensis]|uniref:Uncharacterized protein n=1 Tax=Dioscorea zingiberensis TaxID=325984 RepID=A0A9D5H1Z5_9LILI|nr:hypothetical protein J5N97_002030 [Dioscorea zingiberensis]